VTLGRARARTAGRALAMRAGGRRGGRGAGAGAGCSCTCEFVSIRLEFGDGIAHTRVCVTLHIAIVRFAAATATATATTPPATTTTAAAAFAVVGAIKGFVARLSTFEARQTTGSAAAAPTAPCAAASASASASTAASAPATTTAAAAATATATACWCSTTGLPLTEHKLMIRLCPPHAQVQHLAAKQQRVSRVIRCCDLSTIFLPTAPGLFLSPKERSPRRYEDQSVATD
jgi:hypothetical protein